MSFPMNSPRLRASARTPAPIGRRGGVQPRPVARRLSAPPLSAGRMLAPSVAFGGRRSLTGLPLVAPDPPSLTRAREAAVARTAEPEKESRPWYAWQNVASNILSTLRLPYEIGKALPTLTGKAAQSVVGLGETVFDIGADIIAPGAYTSRSEVDYEKGKKLGLKGPELLAYSMQRTVPFFAPIVESVPKTAARALETGSAGSVATRALTGRSYLDTGEPGFDYYNAIRRNELGPMLFEDIGNVVLVGRTAGLGNVGVRAGQRVAAGAAAGSSRARLGQSIATAGRFSEEPIASSIRGLAGGVRRLGTQYAERAGKQLSPRMQRAVDTAGLMSESTTPLMTGASRAAESVRLKADKAVTNLDEKIATLSQERRQADLAGDTERVVTLDQQIVKETAKRASRARMGETTFQARRTQAEQTRQEAARQGVLRSAIISFDELGATPEAVEVMRTRATELRNLADQREQLASTVDGPQAEELRASAQSAREFADFNDRMADVKQANPQKLQDVENRAINFEAANIINSKLIDQILVDLDNGLTLAQIMERVQPKELVQRTIEAGYGYTPEGVQRAIDFVRGAVDEVDRLEMDVASRIINMMSTEMSRLVQQPGTLVGGLLSPAQFGDIPMPEILVIELDKRKFAQQVYILLDDETANVIRENFDEVAEQLGDRLDKPTGLFKELATKRPDTPEYQAAYAAVGNILDSVINPATSVFRNKPRVALEVAQFFSNPAIYPARMRPMLAYRESARQDLRASDVNDMLFGLRQIVDEFPEMVTARNKATLKTLLDKLAKSDTVEFDRAFYISVRDLMNGVVRDFEKRRGATSARLGEAGRRVAETDARLAEVEAQARSVAAMVEEALLTPERFTPDITEETQALREQADQIDADARQLAAQPDRLEDIRKQIGEQNTRLEQEQASRREVETEVLTFEQQLAVEQKLLDDAALDEDGMASLLAEINEAEMLARSGSGADPTPAEQKAWKQQRLEEIDQEMQFWENAFSDVTGGVPVRPQLSGKTVETPTGRTQEVNKTRSGLGINRMFLDSEDFANYIQTGIPNPSHRIAFRRDHTVEGQRRDPGTGVVLPTKGQSIDTVARGLPEEEFLQRVTEAYTRYMTARDEFNRIEKMPFKGKYGEQVKQAMLENQEGMLDEHVWQNPVTGEEIRGIRSLSDLRKIENIARDQDTLAEQVRVVRALQTEIANRRTKIENLTRRINDINDRISDLARRSTLAEASSPKIQAARLISQANGLRTEAARLEAENVKAGRLAATERITVRPEDGKPLRAGRLVRSEGEVVGYQFTAGVAKKLTAEQTAQLRTQERAHQEMRQLQARLNEEDNALYAGQEVAGGAQQYPQSFGVPSGTALLQGAQRPRLMGETDQPAWMPVGEASGVFESVRAPKTITTEGMAAENRASIENQRQSTFMPLTPGQFARRMQDILSQTSRNRVVNSILMNEQFASDVQTVLTPERYAQMQAEAEANVRATGIPRNTAELEQAVRLELGNNLITELERKGFEPVSSVTMPDPDNPYAAREAVGDLLGVIKPMDMKPTTLVMKKGLRENIAAQYRLAGTENLPAGFAVVAKGVQNKTAEWKSVVLPFSTRWQVGDVMGNVINAAIRGGMSPIDTIRLTIQAYRRINPGKRMSIPKMAQPLFGGAIIDPVISVLVGAGLQTANIKLSELNRMHPKGSLKPSAGTGRLSRWFFPRIREASFNFNETQNGLVRSALADYKLQQELDARGRNISEIDPVDLHNDPVLYEAVVDAVKEANDALGNFSQLSFSEKQYIRAVYPFWSWIKFINTAAGQLLLNQPDRVLFYAHLGSMALGDDGEELYGWMRGQVPVPTPWGTFLMDLSFLNPYSDAIAFQRDPFAEAGETFTNISPVLSVPASSVNELAYFGTGRRLPFLPLASRPGYLEGRSGETTRRFGDTLGGIGYQAFRAFGGPLRLVPEMLPNVYIPGTDVLLGPGPRYPQGSPRTTGIYSRPRLSPTQQRVSALLRTFGVPAPTSDLEQAQAQASEQRRAGTRALRRREQERRLSRIGR